MTRKRSLVARAAIAITAVVLLLPPGIAQAHPHPSLAPDADPGRKPGAVDIAKLERVQPFATEQFESNKPQWWCPSGAVCFYTGWDGTGNICYSYGDVWSSGCVWRSSYFNNGTPCGNCDHVYVRDFNNSVFCLHYGWAEGHGTFPTPTRIVAYWWGGEC